MFINVSSHDTDNSRNSSVRSDNNLVGYPSRTVVHPKLEMTEPGDADEREADLAAHDVMSGKVFRKFSGGGAGGGMAVSSQMESQLNQLQGGGQAMPDGLRGMMERGFDRDFSQVRLHTDGEAAGLSDSIHAKAFTHGNDIYFNQGQYAPETSEGQRLVAHELAHVAQGGGKVGREWGDSLANGMCEELPMGKDGVRDTLNGVGSTLLDMDKDKYGNYQTVLKCIQRYFGYMEEYDKIFAYFTSMQRKRFFFKSRNVNYSIWAWKGDYLNLGLGTELGIYKGDKCNKENLVCLADADNHTMEMAVTKLQYLGHNYCVDTTLKRHFWATTFINRSQDQYSSFIIPLIAEIALDFMPPFVLFKNKSDVLANIKGKLAKMRNSIDGQLINSENITSEFTIKYSKDQEHIIDSFKRDANPESQGWSFDKANQTATFLFEGKGDPFSEGEVIDENVCLNAILDVVCKVGPVFMDEYTLNAQKRVEAVGNYWGGPDTIMGNVAAFIAASPVGYIYDAIIDN